MSRIASRNYQCVVSQSLGQRCRDVLPADVWYIIFDALEAHGRQWLYNVCLVCRRFHALATPSLYRKIVLRSAYSPDIHRKNWPDSTYSGLNSILRLLGDESSEHLRLYVREVTISNIGEINLLWKALEVASRLPNLRNVVFHGSENLPRWFIDALATHPRRPTLELHDQDGTMMAPAKLSPVSSLHAVIDVGAGVHEGPNLRLLGLQKLLFDSPNLRSLSLSIVDKLGYCNLRHLMFPSITNFHLTESDVFPPIRELCLNGYQIGHIEWPHWRDGFRWEELSSLTLGPQPDLHNLGLLTGYVHSLRHLTLLAYSGEEGLPTEDIDRFLMSFKSLVHLEMKGHSCSVEAVTNHPNLVHICLHECELSPEQLAQPRSSIQRKTLTVSDLELLHSRCPYVEYLEIDCNRRDDHWPEDVLLTLATQFSHLRYLSLHLELGIANIHAPILPVLNYASAQDIGQAFFRMRFPRPLQSIILKTGESLRRFTYGEPVYRKWEQLHSATFEIRAKPFSRHEMDIAHVERDVLRGLRLKDELDATNPVDLRLRVEAAVHGACASGVSEEGKTGLLGGDTYTRIPSRCAIPA